MAWGHGWFGRSEVAEREAVVTGREIHVEEAEVVFGELGRRGAKAPRGVGLGSQDGVDAGRVGPAHQVGAELGAVLVSLFGVLAHQLADDRGERSGHAARQVFERLADLPCAA